ncbi:zeta toxin family protein [Streptosporangium lutulentum]|uniref:UDP-N-acetylglucosamine kinase n=1 Tax=Streptosporangium lutulentum TaxID=1461250 RepID=A0ABT9QUR0_9ACTN|nr:zeta toxin family protein [Streptosporangium lutulentum]MDP9850477.1 hypothetical protein [Streptosporangium lutulentum]
MRIGSQDLRERRVDVVIETTMQNPAFFADSVAQYRSEGYRPEVAFLAVPQALSRQGILHRYHEQVRDHGHGRLTVPEKHETSYSGILTSAELIDAGRLADTVVVFRRGNTLLYANHVGPDGQRGAPPRTRQAIEAERLRPWAETEVQEFEAVQQRLRTQMDPGHGLER